MAESVDARRVFEVVDPHTSFLKYLVNLAQSAVAVVSYRPHVVVSSGAGVAIASCLLGKLLGAKLIFVETAACVVQPSRTGKLIYRFADLFIVQWEALLEHYPKAVYGGCLV